MTAIAPVSVLETARAILERSPNGSPTTYRPPAESQAWEQPIPLTDGERPDFPTHHLPVVLRTFVELLAAATQTPAALAALLSLAVVAAAAAKRVAVRVRKGWIEPVNIFVLIALPPGNRKSAVFAEAVEPLERFEAEEADRMALTIAQDQSRRKILEKQLERAQRDAAAATSCDDQLVAREEADRIARELHDLPSLAIPRLIVDDVSPEKLANLLAEQDGRMAVLSAEGGLFETMAGRYSQSGTPNLDVFLKGHSGDTLRVDRMGRPPDFVVGTALTLGLAVQPEVTQGLATKPGFRGRGLLARHWFARPDSLVGRRMVNPPPLPDGVRSRYASLVRAVLALPLGNAEGETATPRFLDLSDGAAEAFLDFEQLTEPRLGEHGDLCHIADWGGKLAGAVARLAGLLHLASMPNEASPWVVPISAETMASAIAIAETFLVPHALLAFAEMGADPAIEDARHVLLWLERYPEATVSKRDVHQNLKRRFPRAHQLDPALGILVERGYLREQEPATRDEPRGRKASPRYDINPLWRSHKHLYPQNHDQTSHCGDSENSENGYGEPIVNLREGAV